MGDSSDDESSDSSNGFLISADKINLDSNFFTLKTSKLDLKPTESKNDDFDDNDGEFRNVTEGETVEMFSQILQNLQKTEVKLNVDENIMGCERAFSSQAEQNKENSALLKSQNAIISQEINELLLQGESKTSMLFNNNENADDENDKAQPEYSIPKDGVKITLPGTGLTLGKPKKGAKNTDSVIRYLMNKLKAHQVLIHKVGLLCWLGYGFHLNKLATESSVMSGAQSLISQKSYPKDRVDLPYLEKFTKWFKKLFTIETYSSQVWITMDTLLERLKDRKILDYKELILLYIAALRAIGLNCRLVVSLYPPNLKLQRDLLMQPKNEKDKSDNSKSKESSIPKNKKISDSKTKKVKRDSSKEKEEVKDNKSTIKFISENSSEAEKAAKLDAKKKAAEILQKKSNKNIDQNKLSNTKNVNMSKKSSHELADDSQKQDKKKTKLAHKKQPEDITISRKLRSRVISNTENMASTSKELCSSKDTSFLRPSRKPKEDASKSSIKYITSSDSDDSAKEFCNKHPIKTKIIKKPITKSNKSKKQKEDKEASSLNEEENSSKRESENLWVEVYVESEQSWTCVSLITEKINCIAEIYKRAKSPVLYVVAWNSEGSIKDVTRRYCPQWLTVTRKQRVEEKWWAESLIPWKEKETPISKVEDEMFLQRELERPLPKTIGECKGHPLYVLTRHLLKYEALYPPDCVPLGHLATGEAIYSRYCVYTLCSRETWLKKARVVKPNQEPYKIVKAMPKYDKLSGIRLKDEKLELFGQWQTAEYVPPEAKDGIVPRNEYGNVDLFKECMLPKGTVHVDLPALNRIARKLNIDCAPAVVGFKFGAMGAVPAFKGFVVCKEYEDILRGAWEAEQVEAAIREKEKREKRIYGNWKKLIRGLLIREKLAAKYEFQDEQKASVSNKRTKHKKTDGKKIKSV